MYRGRAIDVQEHTAVAADENAAFAAAVTPAVADELQRRSNDP